MDWRFFKLGIVCASVLALSGCAYENAAQRAEIETKNTLLTKQDHVDVLLSAPTIDAARYAFRLSDSYKVLGDTAATNRDKFAGGIIVAAGAGALGAATSVGATELAVAALIGLGLNEVVRYTNQGGASEAFYKSSDEMACIASTTIGFIGSETHRNLTDTAVVLEYVRRAELRLRSGLRRTVPDYTAVRDAFANGILDPQILDKGKSKPSLKALLEICLPEEKKESPADASATENKANAGGGPTVVTPTL